MNRRHHPAEPVARVHGAASLVAQVSPATSRRLRAGGRRVDYRATYSAQRALGGGVLLDAIHEIDYVLWLLGPARRAAGMTAQASALELDVEDVAHVLVEHESGALSSIAPRLPRPGVQPRLPHRRRGRDGRLGLGARQRYACTARTASRPSTQRRPTPPRPTSGRWSASSPSLAASRRRSSARPAAGRARGR